jgi:hypothetical protein
MGSCLRTVTGAHPGHLQVMGRLLKPMQLTLRIGLVKVYVSEQLLVMHEKCNVLGLCD